jgi:hypothetical protein
MSETNLAERNTPEIEQLRRDFLNAMFGLIKGLSLYDLKNAAIQRPLQNFEKALQEARALLPEP